VRRAVKSAGVTDVESGEDETDELTGRFVATVNARLDNDAPEYDNERLINLDRPLLYLLQHIFILFLFNPCVHLFQ